MTIAIIISVAFGLITLLDTILLVMAPEPRRKQTWPTVEIAGQRIKFQNWRMN